ncbi:unnamed protein product [Staurois parvus]|uniref:Uncharacterized protein n=1 Tax=Staurois parvus TaxID=386267 RepID=A0ABN9C5A2_9NEOB|nr:unnamed protein product [Staurois parvus]
MSCQSAHGRYICSSSFPQGLSVFPVCYVPVGGPMRCPWYLFHRLFFSLGKDTWAP